MARKKRKHRLRGALFIIAIALLIAGFMIRRMMIAGAMRRASAARPSANAAPSPAYAHNGNPQREHISDADRKRLDQLIREKSGGGR